MFFTGCVLITCNKTLMCVEYAQTLPTWPLPFFLGYLSLTAVIISLECFDAVVLATGRASGLKKNY